MTTEWHKRARKLRKAGWTLVAIANVCGKAWSTVYWAVNNDVRAHKREYVRRYREEKRAGIR